MNIVKYSQVGNIPMPIIRVFHVDVDDANVQYKEITSILKAKKCSQTLSTTKAQSFQFLLKELICCEWATCY